MTIFIAVILPGTEVGVDPIARWAAFGRRVTLNFIVSRVSPWITVVIIAHRNIGAFSRSRGGRGRVSMTVLTILQMRPVSAVRREFHRVSGDIRDK